MNLQWGVHKVDNKSISKIMHLVREEKKFNAVIGLGSKTLESDEREKQLLVRTWNACFEGSLLNSVVNRKEMGNNL